LNPKKMGLKHVDFLRNHLEEPLREVAISLSHAQ